jgi:hypothetical protein
MESESFMNSYKMLSLAVRYKAGPEATLCQLRTYLLGQQWRMTRCHTYLLPERCARSFIASDSAGEESSFPSSEHPLT